jgi:hypothetical protein
MPRQRRQVESRPLGLDEIMIVNPGATPVRLRPIAPLNSAYQPEQRPALFVGDNGVIYALQRPAEPVRPGDLILGADGTLGQVGAGVAGNQLAEGELLDDDLDLPGTSLAPPPQAHSKQAMRIRRGMPRLRR